MSATSILSLRIHDMERRPDGWHAVVVMDGQSRQVDRIYGSWRVTPQADADGALPRCWCHVRPDIAAELQKVVRRLEKAGTVGTDTVPEKKENSTMSAATKAKPSKAAKAKAAPKGKAKPAKAKAKTNGGMSRDESRKRQDEALKMHAAGKSYKEIMAALGFANPGHTYNSVVAAKKRRDGGGSK